MLYVPADRSGKMYKFARPFRGPYQVVRVMPNGVKLLLTTKPKVCSIRVSLDRVQGFSKEMTDLDDVDEVPVSGLSGDLDVAGKTKGLTSSDTTGLTEPVEAQADKQREK